MCMGRLKSEILQNALLLLAVILSFSGGWIEF